MSEPIITPLVPKCGGCRHWVKSPTNPANLTERRGECRESPPHATAIPHGQSLVVVSHYPNLPADFPACSRYESAVTVVH